MKDKSVEFDAGDYVVHPSYGVEHFALETLSRDWLPVLCAGRGKRHGVVPVRPPGATGLRQVTPSKNSTISPRIEEQPIVLVAIITNGAWS
jgi:hypothetical protein